MGIASLVLGILGLFVCPIILAVLAIIFGAIGISRANRGEATNKGVATAGLVIGIIGIPLSLILSLAVWT